MALTIRHQPQTVSPVYNDLMFVVSTDRTNFDNLKFAVKLYYAGTLIKTLRYDRWPHGSYIQADVHRMLESRFTPYINNLANGLTGFQQATGTFADYKVEVAEELSGTPIASGTVTASGLYAFTGALKYLDWIDYDYSQYNLQTGSQRKLLTNSPRTLNIREEEMAELGFISTTKIVNKAVVTTYDAAGSIINTHEIDNILSGPDVKNMAPAFMCGPHSLGDSIVTADTKKYTVQFYNTDNQPVSEVFTYIIDRTYSRHQLFRLHFLNRWGRFDSFTFKGAHKRSLTYERSNYQKYTGYTELFGLTWVNNGQARGEVTFDTKETEQFTLNSDWITEEESMWLQELAGSPVVYWQADPSAPNKTIAVSVTETNYEVKNYGTKKLFNLTLTMQLAQPNFRQRA